jgi:hypothetical protein
MKALAKDVTYEVEITKKLSEKKFSFGNIFKLNRANSIDFLEVLKEKIKKEFDEQIKKIIDVCLLNNKFDSSDEIWYILLDNIIDLRDNIM